MHSDSESSLIDAAGGVLIDGVPATSVVTPAGASAVAEILTDAAERNLTVAPVGGGTALTLGNPPERVDLALSTRNLGGIIDYEPTDLVLSVGAGARLGDVQAVLAEHGQTLPIDPPGGDDATIGGLIATALTGPRRLSAGSLRDLLIGISVAHPSGTVTRAGGMVVKNVSGFDLPRVYHGSLGTLGVIVSANFKVLPLPRSEATVLARVESLELALRAATALRAGMANIAALEAGRFDEAWFVAVRCLGRETSVQNAQTKAIELLEVETSALDRTASTDWWNRYQHALRLTVDDDEVLVRCSVRPRETSTLALCLAAELASLDAELRFLGASVGLGTVVARIGLTNGSADKLAEVQTALLALANHVTILAAPPRWKEQVDVWGQTPETLDVMQAMKEQFDPRRVLNPGRFAGRI